MKRQRALDPPRAAIAPSVLGVLGRLALLALLAACDVRVVELGTGPHDDIELAPDAPPDIAQRFPRDPSAGEIDDKKLSLRYPEPLALLPRNLASLDVMWKGAKELDRFELTVTRGGWRRRVYTTRSEAALSNAGWAALLAAPEATPVQLVIRGLASDDPERLFRSEPVTITVTTEEATGEIYYWSTVSQAVMRADLQRRIATRVYPTAADRNVGCVGCHTLSRDGRRMALGDGTGALRQLPIPTDPKTPPPGESGPPDRYGWSTYNPGATRLLVSSHGRLHLLDAADPAVATEVPLPAGQAATHPDWSPDGRHVVVTLMTRKGEDDKQVEGSSIARLAVQADGGFGPPEILVESAGDKDTLAFPAHSPDGRWIAFMRTEGKSKDAKHGALWLVAADGASPAFELGHLSRPGSAAEAGGADPGAPGMPMPMPMMDKEALGKEVGNSMPTWAPGPGRSHYWLTFSSNRDLGAQHMDDKRDQLWGAALDVDINPPEDPSHPAFWLPFQRPEDSNHRAQWAPTPVSSCADRVELCDRQDDDCDGRIDEDCCAPEAEQCGDGLDNDCDGERDEGCDCSLVDACDNGLDEDCDMRVDEDCLF